MVSYPDFDLNKREKIVDLNFINRATKGVYELGSVFKTFTVAAGLEEGLIDTDTEFLNLEKKIQCGKSSISEYDNKIPSDLTVAQILIRSGNIGSVRIGQKLEIIKLKAFLEKIGILSKINFDIEEVGEPIPFKWGKCKLATVSFGHGITTTPLQLAKAYAIISNGAACWHRPMLLANRLGRRGSQRSCSRSAASCWRCDRDECRRFEVPAPGAATFSQELQIEERHSNVKSTGVPLLPKFV